MKNFTLGTLVAAMAAVALASPGTHQILWRTSQPLTDELCRLGGHNSNTEYHDANT